jgi:hypothetical protein
LPIRLMTDYGTRAAPMRGSQKTAGHAKSGPADDPVGRVNNRIAAGSHYRLPERREHPFINLFFSGPLLMVR